MFHLAAFYKAQTASSLTPVGLSAIQDSYLTVTSDGQYTAPQMLRWLSAYAGGVSMTQARLNTPIFRNIGLPYIAPSSVTAAIPSLFPFIDYESYGPMIPKADQFVVETTNTAGAPDDQYALLWLGDGNKNRPVDQVRTLIATSSITVGNKVWGAGTFTFAQTLPAGRYAVVGMDVVGANLIAARLVFPNGGMRPGCPARTGLSVFPSNQFRNGNFGIWGEFESTSPPSIELFGSAAPTTQTIFLDLVQTRVGV